jgi:hypothetical protein
MPVGLTKSRNSVTQTVPSDLGVCSPVVHGDNHARDLHVHSWFKTKNGPTHFVTPGIDPVFCLLEDMFLCAFSLERNELRKVLKTHEGTAFIELHMLRDISEP